MPAEPDSTESTSAKRKLLPFEPKTRQGNSNAAKSASIPAKQAAPKPTAASAKAAAKPKRSKEGGIPEVVSRRMIRRVAWFSGVPSLLGISTFVVSYIAVTHDVPLPTYAVLLVSLGWFGLGVLGVSYGVMSASWDEESAGSALGVVELQTNWGRMSSAWKETREQARQEARAQAKRAKK
ncbi:MAG: PAM68 family protein [Pegethrix bostrychoides GSE-TBD4-15B]|jgi:hypothetical protein|uniref:PAM68 family protein n=1 Tax=Pegethrix bostrychoides GSE-TBD4-15B TaxID=2839662 RepID=A0A951U4M2_9CYAN|nr:PAM68 family protein [Pegethrix bostrychoides GSE-TBD4-15B]